MDGTGSEAPRACRDIWVLFLLGTNIEFYDRPIGTRRVPFE